MSVLWQSPAELGQPAQSMLIANRLMRLSIVSPVVFVSVASLGIIPSIRTVGGRTRERIVTIASRVGAASKHEREEREGAPRDQSADDLCPARVPHAALIRTNRELPARLV